MTTKAEWVTGSRFMNHALPALAGFLAACGSVSAEQTRPDSGNVGPDAHERGDVLTTLDGRRPSPDGEGKADGQRKADGRSGPDGPGSADGSGSDAGCSSGTPSVHCLASVQGVYDVGYAIAVDDENVYWNMLGQADLNGFVMQTPRRGGATITLAQGTPINSLVSDGTNVYWSDVTETFTAGSGRIISVPVGGGSVTTLSVATRTNCITVDDTNVYWTDTGDGYNKGSGVFKVSKAGGSAMPLTSGAIGDAYDAIVVDATNVYWASGGGGLMSVGKGGGNVVTLVDGSTTSVTGACNTLAVSGDSLFTTLYPTTPIGTTTVLGSVPSNGSGSLSVLDSQGNPLYLVANATALFWVGLGSAIEIGETPIGGGATKTLSMPNVHNIYDLALASDGTLYWTTSSQVQSLTP